MDKPLKLKINNGKIKITGNVKVKIEGEGDYYLAKDSEITKIVAFAGKGCNKPVRVAEYLSKQYGGNEKNWKHTRGQAIVSYKGNAKTAEIHWFDNNDVGYVKMKVKRWLKNEG